MKYIITCICFMLTTMVMAQSGMTNTTTITVEKNVDGKIVKEVKVIEGDGADKKLAELEKDKTVVSINVEKRVEMRSDDPNSKEMQKMKKEIEVEIQELEKVTGEKAERREENVEIEVTANDKEEIKKYKVKIIEDGKEEIIEWNGEGEMPAKMKKVMDGTQVIVKTEGNTTTQQFKIINAEEMGIKETVTRDKNNNRGQIGVRISSAKGGVAITEFTQNSMAQAAGLQVGDVINGVNDKAVITMQDLVNALTPYKPGDIVTINFVRRGAIMKKDVKMAKRK